jgi:hypothetical protein
MAADPSYAPKVYRKQGAEEFVVADGGTLRVESGGTVVVESGATMTVVDGAQAPLEAITINYTGTPVLPFVCNVIPPIAVQINDTLHTASGKWVEGLGTAQTETTWSFAGCLTIDLPDLAGVRNDICLQDADITEITMDALVIVGGGVYITGNTSATEIDLSALTTVGGRVNITSNTATTEIDLPALTTVGGYFGIGAMPLVTSLVLTDIQSIGGAIQMEEDIDALTTFTLGSGLLSVGSNVAITSPTLAEASVDNTLIRLAALDGTGDTTLYTGHTVNLSGNCAPPSATGLAARLALIAASNQVTINGNFAITAAAVNPDNTFTVAGDKSSIFTTGTAFTIAGSTGNDGTYTVVSSVFGAATVITVSESVGDATSDGTITQIISPV